MAGRDLITFDKAAARLGISESDVKDFCRRIVAHVIGIRTKRKTINELEGATIKNLASAILAVGHKQRFEIRRIEHPLRHALPRDAEDPLVRLEVNYLNSVLVIAECRSE